MLEAPSRIEPCLLDAYPPAVSDRIAELVRATALLGSRLHPSTAESLAELVRVMNCYYSNLIEGHDTRPRDIERALARDFDDDAARRDLQLEARAHIRVQREVDRLSAEGRYGEPASQERLRWLHREFYADAPASMLRMEGATGFFDMVPGSYRSEPHHDVSVGRHQPPSSVHVAEFMAYFERRYRLEGRGASEQIVAFAAAHHRLNYIHPFSDGNGRVSRLMSHAMGHSAGIAAHGLWSISRGLARGLKDAGEYKRMMDATDAPRRGDLDGRGNLSLEALVEFVCWFCDVAIDQIQFMSGLFALESLERRIEEHVRVTLRQPPEAFALCSEVLRRGELARGEASRITGKGERTARSLLSDLLASGLLTAESHRAPVRLSFGVATADSLFPRLFPAQLGR